MTIDRSWYYYGFKRLSLTIALSLFSFFLYAQINVTGTIASESGELLENVTVTVKGTNQATTSDVDGKFSITVPSKSSVLIFTSVGYVSKEVTVGNQTNIDVFMATSASDMEQVVVVAYGRQKKISLTGSVATVSGNVVKQSPATNLSNSLAGRLPGLVATQRGGEPGADGSGIMIRGVSTTGDNSPLVVVDGVPGRSLQQINPNDIESISILKDAAAAAYGARSANGVILVTTKRGISGKTSFDYNGNYGWQMPTRLPEFVNSYDYARLHNVASLNDNPSGTPTYSNEAIEKYRDGSDRDRYPNTNWMKEGLRSSAPQTQHTITMRGGGKAARFFASAGYFGQEGLWIGNATNFKRYNFTSNVDFRINDNFTGVLDIQGRQENRDNPGISTSTIFSSMLRPGAVWPARYSNGLLGGGYNNGGSNPIIQSSNASGFVEDKRNILQTRLTLRHELPFVVKGLALEGVFSYDKNYRHVKNWSTPYDFYVLNTTTGDYEKKTVNGTAPALSEGYTNDQFTYGRVALDYMGSFGKHSVNAIALYEFDAYRLDSLTAARRNYGVNYPYINFGNVDNFTTNAGYGRENARTSFFGRINYDYDNKYLLELSLRGDKSINFIKESRLGYFPAVSAGWVISSEDWFESNAINLLKLRTSWSRRGNDIIAIGDADYRYARFNYTTLYGYNSRGYVFNGQAVPTAGIAAVGNPNVTWEKADTYNLGIDAAFLGNRLTFTSDVFVKKTKDILGNRGLEVPLFTGIALPNENISKVSTRGAEVEVGWRETKRDWGYYISGNLSYARSRVDYQAEADPPEEYQRITGRPVSAGLYYVAQGFFQSQDDITRSPSQSQFGTVQPGDIKYKDVNGDGVITALDRIRINTTQNPLYMYGFSLGANWKGFDISMLLQGAAGVNLYLSEEAAFPFFNGGNLLQSWVDNYWTPENPGAKYPRLFLSSANNTQASTFWLKNASYLRIKNVEIGYNLPERLLSRVSINGARVFVSGLNLFTFDGIKTVDPEYPNGRGWNYPQQRVVNVGVSVQF